MPLRVARYSDIDCITEILAAAFEEEDTHIHLFPHRKEYPDDYVTAWKQRVYERWWDYARIYIVSYETNSAGQETLNGVAEWQVVGESWRSLWNLRSSWDPRLKLSKLIARSNQLSRYIFPNRASIQPTPADPNPLTTWNIGPVVAPFIEKYFREPLGWRNYWKLSVVATKPGSQNRGTGRELVAWGLERARNDGLPCVVNSAVGRDNFYRRCGFVHQVGWTDEGVDGDGNPNPLRTMGIKGCAILWTCEPKAGDPVDVSEE